MYMYDVQDPKGLEEEIVGGGEKEWNEQRRTEIASERMNDSIRERNRKRTTRVG